MQSPHQCLSWPLLCSSLAVSLHCVTWYINKWNTVGFFLHPLPPPYKYGGVYWNHFVCVCLSICSSVGVSNPVLLGSPELFNHFLPNLVWRCVIMRWCVFRKNWFTLFDVSVTARAYIIKIWLFLLCLLDCWSVCNQIWFDSEKTNFSFAIFKIKVRARAHMIKIWPFLWYLVNCGSFCHQTWCHSTFS